ncbi:unnamed protein product, partial [Scytosiphon promiscuus]
TSFDLQQFVYISHHSLYGKARDGMFTDEDWQLTLTRAPVLQTVETKPRFADATRLFLSKNEVKRYNGKKVRGIGNPVLKSAANYNCATAERAPSDAAGGLEKLRVLVNGSKVMLTKNLWQEVGLVIGICGEVVEIVYAEGWQAPAPPHYVVVLFQGFIYRGRVPISAVEATWSACGENGEGSTMTRAQLPLKLCWTLTMLKSQGQTLSISVTYLGKIEACKGLTFVCLCRTKRIVDLIVYLMPFDRLNRLGQSPVLKARLVEEVRPRLLADQMRNGQQ